MISSRVIPEDEIFSMLQGRGFERTDKNTATGTFWRHAPSGKHLLVPFSVQGFCPDWWIADLEERIEVMGLDG